MGNQKRSLNVSIEEFINVYNELRSVPQVAKFYNKGFSAIRGFMKKHNIKLNKNCKKKYNYNESIFELDTEETFYWAGFLAADGNVRKTNKHGNVNLLKLAIAQSDRQHLEQFKKFAKTDAPIYDFTSKTKKGTIIYYSQLVLNSEKICKDLERFGIITRKSLILEFPEWLIDHPLVNHFIRGYIDGDGSFTLSKRSKHNRKVTQIILQIVGTKNFLTNIYKIIDKQSNITIIDRKVKLAKNSKAYRVGWSGNNVISSIYNFLYNGAIIFLKRKEEVAAQAQILSEKSKEESKLIRLNRLKNNIKIHNIKNGLDINYWPNSKLTMEIANQIREEYYNDNISYRELGEKYKVSTVTIGKIIKNKSWKNVA